MKDKILKFVSERGPVLSKDVARHFAINSTYSGAYLSELIQDKHLLFSNIKVGTSPLYYTIEQKSKLVSLFEHLNDKDQETFNLLKEKKVLKDRELPTITRVSLRNLKDFAYPISVTIKGQKEIFWKWYLLTNEEVFKFIQPQKSESEVKEESEKEKLLKLKHILDEEKKALENEKLLLQKQSFEHEKKLLDEFIEKESNIRDEYEKKLKDASKFENEVEDLKKKLKDNDVNVIKKEYEGKLKNSQTENFSSMKAEYEKEIQVLKLQLNQDEQTFLEPKNIDKENDIFLSKCKAFFDEKNIEILRYNILKKDSEVEFTLKVPSVIGKSEYYCRARDKKRCNEGDLSTAFVSGQIKKLPTLFLSPGDITKKSQSMLANEFKNTLIYKKLE